LEADVVTMMTSREFNQHTSAAKQAARSGPVLVTDRGRPRHVLMTYEEYERLTTGQVTLAQAFARMTDTSDIEIDFPRVHDLPRAAVFD
jgi:prevent-host-death family protein